VTKILIFDEIGNIWDLWQIFLTNFALFGEQKMTVLAAKSGGDLDKALSHKFTM